MICRHWRRPWPSGRRACCCGATSPPPGRPGWGRKTRRDESKRGPFLDTWSAIGLPWGRGDKPAVSIVGSLDPERLDAALEGAGDGLAARFLDVWPGPAPYRSLRTLKPTREDEAVNALQRIARAVGRPEKPMVLACLKARSGRRYSARLRTERLSAPCLQRHRSCARSESRALLVDDHAPSQAACGNKLRDAVRRADLDDLPSSRAAQTVVAENHVGLPF